MLATFNISSYHHNSYTPSEKRLSRAELCGDNAEGKFILASGESASENNSASSGDASATETSGFLPVKAIEKNRKFNLDQIKCELKSTLKDVYINPAVQTIKYILSAAQSNFSDKNSLLKDLQKYLREFEISLINFWSNAAIKTDGFTDITGSKSINFIDEGNEVQPDLTRFINMSIKRVLEKFIDIESKIIIQNLSYDRLFDLSADFLVIKESPTLETIGQTINKEIHNRLANSFKHLQANLKTLTLAQMRQLTEAAYQLRTLTQHIKVPINGKIAAHIDLLYKQLLASFAIYHSLISIEALQELEQALLILRKYASVPDKLSQAINHCWHGIAERMADNFHHALLKATPKKDPKDIIRPIYQLITAHEALPTSAGQTAADKPFESFISTARDKLKEGRSNRLTEILASAQITELKGVISIAEKKLEKDYPMQSQQLKKILACFKRHSDRKTKANSFPTASFLRSGFSSGPVRLTAVNDYLNSIREIFRIDIDNLDQNVKVRVLRGNVPLATLAAIQKNLEKDYETMGVPKELMKKCMVASQYDLDAGRGATTNGAFNGKKVFNDPEQYEPQQMKYIFADPLRKFCDPSKLIGLSSCFSQMPFNVIDPAFTHHKIITLPRDVAIEGLTSKSKPSIQCNARYADQKDLALIEKSKYPKNSIFVEVSLERTNIESAVLKNTMEITTLPEPEKNHMRWKALFVVSSNKAPLVGSISFDYSLPEPFSTTQEFSTAKAPSKFSRNFI